MTQWTNERIPIWLAPVEGEALDSWLEAYARRLRVTTFTFLHFVGLERSRLSQMVLRLNDRQRHRLHQVTGVSQQALTEMTLEPFDGITVNFHPYKHGMGRPSTWRAYGSHSRFCPRCLSDNAGRWPLAWRQPWVFACTSHRCLLLERCPGCEQPVRAHGTRLGGPTQPTLCTRGHHKTEGRRRLRIACGYPLGEATAPGLPAHGLVMASQQHVTGLLDEARLHPNRIRPKLLDLYALGWRSLAAIAADPGSTPPIVNQVIEETGGQLPSQTSTQDATDAHSIATATAIARLALPGSDVRQQPEVLAWIMRSDHRLFPNASPNQRAFNWQRTSPRLAGLALSHSDADLTLLPRLRYGTASPQPFWKKLADEDVHRRAASVPSKLWPSWTMRLLSPNLANYRSVDRFRKAVSTLIMFPGSQMDYGPAASLLGQQLSRNERIAAIRSFDCYSPSSLTSLAAAITQIAWALDENGAPIDYARRRKVFHSDSICMDEPALLHACRQAGWNDPSPAVTERLRWILLSLLGVEPEIESGKLSSFHHFRQHLPTQVREFLYLQAESALEQHGIDEPLRWEPPARWAENPGWPGFDEAAVNLAQASELASHSPVEQQLAKELGLTTTHLRLYFESRDLSIPTPPPTPRRPRKRRASPSPRRKAIPRIGPLAPAQLRQLYQAQGRTLGQIAVMAGCSVTTVSLAINEAGIPKRSRRPARFLERTVSREWLEVEYHHKGRSSPDIARELGVRKGSVMKLVKKWEIPKHSAGQYNSSFAQLHVAISPAMQSVSRTKNCIQRLQHITTLSEHATLQSAARTLGVRWNVLNYQLKQIERTAGFTIIDRRSRPLTVTRAGRSFLDEAARLLALLEGHAT